MSLVQLNFESEFLQSSHDISIVLPNRPRDEASKDYYANGKKYPVIWLLHGTFGDHSDWIRKSNIEYYATKRDICVVCPSAMNSNYTNWPKFGMGYNMWDYLTEELMPLMQNWFPISDKREDNFIGGLSMGGTGVMQYVCAYPEKFAGAAVLSWAPYDFATLKDGTSPFGGERQDIMIENAGGIDNYMKSVENVWDQLPELAKSGKLPQLYFAIGTDDFLWEPYVAFKKYAQEIGLEATFEEYEGYGHQWPIWDKTILKALELFGFKSKDAVASF